MEIHASRALVSPVKILIGSLADGMKPAEILEAYPQLSEKDLLGALAYAAEVLRGHPS